MELWMTQAGDGIHYRNMEFIMGTMDQIMDQIMEMSKHCGSHGLPCLSPTLIAL